MRSAMLQAAGLLAGCTGALAPAPVERTPPVAVMPAPPRHDPADGRLADNAACERCHSVIAAEWRSSQHRSSFLDPEFARAFARERTPFCRTCHAPEAALAGAVTVAAAEVGVGCVTCHTPHDGGPAVLARSASGRAEHAVRASAAFVDVGGCASCHEFDFAARRGLPMQLTVTEHAQSAFATTGCSECHMPEVGDGAARHRSHVFSASRDPEMLRRAVEIDVERLDDATVRIRLAPGEIGHAFPTGDLFRRVLVEAEGFDEDGDPIAYDARPLERRFAHPRDGAGRRVPTLVRDDRVGAPALHGDGGVVDVTLDLGAGADTLEVRWRIVHQRVEFPTFDDEAVIAG
ncbi:MAG TPA: multiheme c-type cytochrome, partial [Nannocystaceae bacterium]|nr:multiheme c-type cytochrome [Nannocystaceae bacterium]